MKKLFISFALVMFFVAGAFAQDDAIVKYFNQYMENDNFTSVYISPKMFQMISKIEVDDPDYNELKPILADIKGLRILVNETEPAKYYNEAIAKINTKEYEVLMTIKDDGENVRFLTKENAQGNISELLLMVGGGDEFVLLSFVGNLDLQKISKLANKLDVKGAEHLDRLEEKKN